MQSIINTQKTSLIEGAQSIVDTFRTPQAFIEFMTDVLTWIHNYELETGVDKKDSIHYSAIEILRVVGFHWMSAKNGQDVEEIAKGIFDLTENTNSTEISDLNFIISKAHHINATESSLNKDSFMADAQGMFALIKIGEAMENFENKVN